MRQDFEGSIYWYEYARNMEQDFKGGGISRYSEISRKYGITVTYRGSTQVTKAKEAFTFRPLYHLGQAAATYEDHC